MFFMYMRSMADNKCGPAVSMQQDKLKLLQITLVIGVSASMNSTSCSCRRLDTSCSQLVADLSL